MKKYQLVLSAFMLLSTVCLNAKADEAMANGVKYETEFVWDGLVSYVCMIQDDKLKHTWYGDKLLNDGGFDDWKDGRTVKTLSCLKEKQLLPKDLCADMFKINPDSTKDYLDELYEKHKAAIDNLEVLNKCK